jgi:anhydro-N-acetylmuramic acid kinase
MSLTRAIGLMSGTSMDGIDVAMIDTDGHNQIIFGSACEFTYSDEMKRRLSLCLLQAQSFENRNTRTDLVRHVENELTQLHAYAVSKFISDNAIDPKSIDVIGFHGQTLVHRPDLGLTIQIGDGQMLADMCQIPVIYDLRANDMLHGGQGAPLIPVYHTVLAAQVSSQDPLAFVNIGGISNVTFVSKDTDPVAFDVGPGNALIDQWVQKKANMAYDEDGRIGMQGSVDEDRLAQYLNHSFFVQKPPKSLDRHDFSPDTVTGLSLRDGAATLAALTARAIVQSQQFAPIPPKKWIICGGGRKNKAILSALKQTLDSPVVVSEEIGLDGSAMEAQGWAYLSVRSLQNLPITFPSTTGVTHPVSGGVLKRPKKLKLKNR